ncbi:MAG: threonine/serine exporter family protein [Bacilli bacterium]|nr:threonine/serine exporter family protein [Bacilli bacterium]
MKEIDRILAAAAKLGKAMAACGANLERVDLAMAKIIHAYGAHDIAIHSLSTSISIAATKNGERSVYQTSVLPVDLDLDRLKELNGLALRIIDEKPDPASVPFMVAEIVKKPQQAWYISLVGFVIAMACLCRIFGGGWQEIVIAELNTLIMFGISRFAAKYRLNRFIVNFISMFIASGFGLLFTYIGFVNSFYIVITTNAFYLINGVGMVNAVRNLLSGKESNGVIELLKVAIEIVSIVAGLGAALYAMGQWHKPEIQEIIGYSPSDFLGYLELVVLSFLASFGFGMVFRIKPRDLIFAALGGALIRIVYILMMLAVPEYRIVYSSIAAFSAALYAEILGHIRKEPSTLYLYPSIVPLIPGDLFYYFGLGIIWNNPQMIAYGPDCLLQLVAISVGFGVCSSTVFWVKRIKFRKIMASIESLVHHPKPAESEAPEEK